MNFNYYSANTFPLKVLLNENVLQNGKIIPVHLQLYPTNKCNFNCSFCSCSNRNRNLELPLDTIIDVVERFRRLGCEATTLTGGGEPILHQNFNDVISEIDWKGIKIGLSTNGTLLNYLTGKTLNSFTWIRVSSSDYIMKYLNRIGYDVDYWLNNIKNAIEYCRADWGFSHVVEKDPPNFKLIEQLVHFANNNNFTHVRLVNDILKAEKLTTQMKQIQTYLKTRNVDTHLVNYQNRSVWTHGSNPCYVSLLKPLVGADGYIYPCCGIQYSSSKPSRKCDESMRMGHIDNLEELWEKQQFFDGSQCIKCYYGAYNQVLHHMLYGIEHLDFV